MVISSYFYEDQRGLFPECQFVYDLEVPEDFVPVNADGEMESFELLPIDTVRAATVTGIPTGGCFPQNSASLDKTEVH